MSLSKTLIGGLIGAAIGIAAHVCLEVFASVEAPWFGVVIGLLVGFGVRRMDPSVIDRASYARGAVAALLTLATIIGSTALIPKVVVAMGARSEKPAPAVAGGDEAESRPAQDGAAAPAPIERALDMPAARGGQAPVMRRGEFNILQFTSIAIGMFLAYEMARGTTRLEEESDEGAAPPDKPADQPVEEPAGSRAE